MTELYFIAASNDEENIYNKEFTFLNDVAFCSEFEALSWLNSDDCDFRDDYKKIFIVKVDYKKIFIVKAVRELKKNYWS